MLVPVSEAALESLLVPESGNAVLPPPVLGLQPTLPRRSPLTKPFASLALTLMPCPSSATHCALSTPPALFSHIRPGHRGPKSRACTGRAGAGIVLANVRPAMTNHPYRIPSLTDESTGRGQSSCTHTCLVCRTRAGLARVRFRSLLVGGAAFAFLMVNVATALVTFTSARLAEKMLAAATSLDRATHEASHARKGARSPEPRHGSLGGHPQT